MPAAFGRTTSRNQLGAVNVKIPGLIVQSLPSEPAPDPGGGQERGRRETGIDGRQAPARRAAMCAASGQQSVYRLSATKHWLNPRRVHPDPVDAGARGDVQRLLVGVAETHIGGLFRRSDGAEVLAFRRDDPNAARPGLVKVAFGIDAHAVRDAALGLLGEVD